MIQPVDGSGDGERGWAATLSLGATQTAAGPGAAGSEAGADAKEETPRTADSRPGEDGERRAGARGGRTERGGNSRHVGVL